MRKHPQNSCTRLSGDFKDAPLSCGACSMNLMERQGRIGRNVERGPSQRPPLRLRAAPADSSPSSLHRPASNGWRLPSLQSDGAFPARLRRPCTAARPPRAASFSCSKASSPERFRQCIEPGGRHGWIRYTRAVIPPAYRAGSSTTPTIPTASRSYAGILLRSASSAAFASSI